MDDALLVRRLERLGDLARDGDRLVDRHRPALQPLGEVLAEDELHDEHVGGRRVGQRDLVERVEVGDARVVERSEQLRLALEAREPVRVGRQRGGQQLQRHLAAEPRIRRAIHLAHAAGADRRARPRMPRDGCRATGSG